MVLVSAIITTHKREPKIVERAIKSVLSQSYKNIELIVVDDSPADYEFRNDVRLMAEQYKDKNVIYIPHEKCSGACVARNTGLSVAKGEFVGFLDDDDEWCPQKVERLLTGFDKEEVGLVYCNRIVRNDTTNEEHIESVEKHVGMVFDRLIMGNFIGSTSFPLMRTEAVRCVGGFDPRQPAVQDLDVWLRIAQKYKINFVDEPLNVYHIHEGDQITKSSDRRVRGMEMLMEKHHEYLKTHKKARWKRLQYIVIDYTNNKRYGKAISTWWKASWLYPFEVSSNMYYLVFIVKVMLRNFLKLNG